MSTTYADYTQQAQEQTLKLIHDYQEGVVEAVRTWATTLEKAVPEIPTPPVYDEFPTAREIVETSFGFAEQLLQAQKEFVESVLTAAAPVLDGPAPAKKSAAKTA
jgi:hypothetical protein